MRPLALLRPKERMISRDRPSQVEAARQALRGGRIDTAARLAATILDSTPNDLDALEIKALVEVERGDDGAAERTLRSAIAADPERRWPYGDLARLLLRLGRPNEAQAVARSALAVDDANADAHAMLGALLTDLLPVEAAAHFERAIAICGGHPQLQLGLGRALLRQGKLAAARPLLEAAAAADPETLESAVALAELEEKLGRFGEAMRQLDRAGRIAVASGTDVDLQRSVLLERMGQYQQALQLLERTKELSAAALLQRGRLCDRLGRYDEAWHDWLEGKAKLALETSRSYPAREVEKQADALADFFDAKRMTSLPRPTRRCDTPQPIFVLGFPRSGTTLTEQILASHTAIRAGGELPFGRELRDLAVLLAGGESAFPQGLGRIEETNWPERLRDHYLARAKSYELTEPGAAFFTDKMPLNEMWLPLLRLAFPESPVVLVRRHPLDVLTSVMAHDMTHGFNCAYRVDDAARHMALMDRLIERYRDSGIELTCELRYEALIADQAGETQRLMQSIGLEMEPAQLRFFERETVSPTPSYAQVREPLNHRSIGRWRNYGEQLEPVRSILTDAMERGGYAA